MRRASADGHLASSGCSMADARRSRFLSKAHTRRRRLRGRALDIYVHLDRARSTGEGVHASPSVFATTLIGRQPMAWHYSPCSLPRECHGEHVRKRCPGRRALERCARGRPAGLVSACRECARRAGDALRSAHFEHARRGARRDARDASRFEVGGRVRGLQPARRRHRRCGTPRVSSGSVATACVPRSRSTASRACPTVASRIA